MRCRSGGEEQALLSSLLEDFRSNEGPLDERIDQHRRMADVADAVLGIVSAADGPAVAVPDSLMASLNPVTTYDATLGTLAEAQSSGRISVIRNQKLRSMLGAWPGRLADALEEQETALFLNLNRLPEVLGDHVSLADLAPATLLFVQGRPLGLGAASREVPVSPGLENYLEGRSRALNRSAVELLGLRAQIDSIVQLLEAEQTR